MSGIEKEELKNIAQGMPEGQWDVFIKYAPDKVLLGEIERRFMKMRSCIELMRMSAELQERR